MLPEGTFRGRGVEAALGYTANDKEQVAVDLVFTDDAVPEILGQHITWYGYFTDKTTEGTLKSLRALGWATDDLSDLSGIDANEVYLVVAHEEDQEGQLRARVRWINASGGGLALKTRMDPGSAKAFAERMKGHVLAAKARAPGVAQPQPSRSAAANSGQAGPRRAAPRKAAAGGGGGGSAPPDDDHIPF